MRERWLRDALQLAGLPSPSTFPRAIVADAQKVLRVSFVALDEVTGHTVRAYLSRRGCKSMPEGNDRDIHGCIVALQGTAFLFYSRKDSLEDQRFTAAHELAHFVLDHLVPRQKALRFFGDSILPVLDLQQKPTQEELLTSALDGVPLKAQIHLMERDDLGDISTGDVLRVEQRADRLAFEWLAPEAVATQVMKQGPHEERIARLQHSFGLPPRKAEAYARVLAQREGAPRFSLSSVLGERNPG
ncbi:ImmA/IrrE family metallo-endopeptidase [Corallococcus macrosporus]|uniref:ImmA/IrrE family metallo-endopeptidase n=1 Tax=Corallococcus macrosporus TaxID=35 RepID=A0ABS3D754_9BACT|nr:ImmA/IrrE family metallo-endopeptidase [Corallococcus macrosporus]MBN8227496.1 ImmA/IrrE family metallo-endopeptidase [Corallococcus macrosporus]